MLATSNRAHEQRWEPLALSDEARDLARTARKHFADLGSVELARRAVAGEVDTGDLWQVLAESGYAQIGVPEEYGGLGSPIDLVVLLEEAGRALLPAPLTTTVAAGQLLLAASLGDDQLGQRRVAFGVASGRVGDARVTCGGVTVAHGADAESVVLLVEEHPAVHVVEIELPAAEVVTTPRAHDLDPSRPSAELSITEATVRRHRQLSAPERDGVLGPVRLCLAADLVGVAAGAFDLALRHVLRRRQFGRELARFQVIKHQLADAYVQVEKARSLVLGTALAVEDEPLRPRTAQLSLLALGSAITAAVAVSSRCVQLLGAMGVTFEADAHLYLRRAHQTALALEPASAAFRAAAKMERAAHGV